MECTAAKCDEPVSRRVVLLNPDGSDHLACAPYCDQHTDDLLRLLFPTYAEGKPAYRIDHEGEDVRERLAETLAGRRSRSKHGQRCPVWTGREENTPVSRCDCWILAGAYGDADAVMAIVVAEVAAAVETERAEIVKGVKHYFAPVDDELYDDVRILCGRIERGEYGTG